MPDINPYNPLDLEALGDSLLREMERRDLQDLAAVPRFGGSGVYALYYVGAAEPYTSMGALNREANCVLPIYLGRSEDPGAREGRSPFEPVTDPTLWRRINQHKNSIVAAADTLAIADFKVRALVAMPIWIPLAEAMAIRRYMPLWNMSLSGFGIHAPGGGRGAQARSAWDELHPGRGFATDRPAHSLDRDALLKQVKKATDLCVLSCVKRLGLEVTLDLPAPDTDAPK